MSSCSIRFSQYLNSGLRIKTFLENKIQNGSRYPDSPTWGYAFSVLLSSSICNGKLDKFGIVALNRLCEQNSKEKDFPWEFVVYAIQRVNSKLENKLELPFSLDNSKGTRMLNWFLLRQLNLLFNGDRNNKIILLKLLIAFKVYTNQDGLIQDELKTRSFQYHAFCLFLLCEIRDILPKQNFINRWLKQGAYFSIKNMLSDGSALWLGRGQEQIFGYGALIYSLEYVNQNICKLPTDKLSRLQKYVLEFQRADGSFPLVLRKRELEPPNAVFSEKLPGWYGYNTLYDYLPFLSYMFWRTGSLK